MYHVRPLCHALLNATEATYSLVGLRRNHISVRMEYGHLRYPHVNVRRFVFFKFCDWIYVHICWRVPMNLIYLYFSDVLSSVEAIWLMCLHILILFMLNFNIIKNFIVCRRGFIKAMPVIPSVYVMHYRILFKLNIMNKILELFLMIGSTTSFM